MSDNRDQLEIDQADAAGRLLADEFFADVPVELQRRGVIESQILAALATLNAKSGKLGVFVLVLMPELVPQPSNAPTPLYDVRLGLQVFESPLFNLGDQGTGKSAEQIAQRIRQLLHFSLSYPGATWSFDGLEPVRTSDESVISYVVFLKRGGGDPSLDRVALPLITADDVTAPAEVTITCATAGAAIYYTLDGSFPSHLGGILYTAPFTVYDAATIRTAAQKTDLQQSNVRELTLT